MKRWHDDYVVARREWKKHRRMHVEDNKDRNAVGKDPYEVDCTCDEQIGRFRKKDAYDCGKSRCFVCHSDKLPKRSKTDQELRSEISFREQVRLFWAMQKK